jgi:hypothetical protein
MKRKVKWLTIPTGPRKNEGIKHTTWGVRPQGGNSNH